MTTTSGVVTVPNGPGRVYYQAWTRQNPITIEPLPYKMVLLNRYNVRQVGTLVPASSYGVLNTYLGGDAYAFALNGTVRSSFPMDRLYNNAYARFSSTVRGEIAEVAVNFGERREAFHMMMDRIIIIRNALRAARQLDVDGLARILGLRTRASNSARDSERRWSRPKQFGSLWLEYHLGWSPLIGDIYAAGQILDGVFPLADDVKETSSFAVVNNLQESGGGFTSTAEQSSGLALCKIASNVSVSDLTLLKLNQLGLINPASVAWELVPLSFIADWFGTIGLWLGSFTDFVGLNMLRPQHVYFVRGQGHRKLTYSSSSLEFDFSVVAVRRVLGIPGPTLALRPFRGLSVTRGLTAISLILGYLRT